MADHLLIESQGPWMGPGAERFLGDAVALLERGHGLWLVLVENAVSGVVGEGSPGVRRVLDLGGRVWVDALALAERGFDATELWAGTEVVDMDAIAERVLAANVKVVWH